VSLFILYGAGSPILGDVCDTCLRLGHTVVAAIQNLADAPLHEPGPVVLRPDELALEHLAMSFAIPLFGPANRETAFVQAHGLGIRRFDPLIDPTALMPSRFTAGEGVYVNAGAVLGSGVRLGRFVFVNRGALVGHHATLADFVSVGPGANIGSLAKIGRGATIGTGAVVASGVTVGEGATVGVGAVALRDVAADTTVLGNPARLVRS
jgi:sugar O-acyltransferase (sialic acid O-acetyltransferase NeuD family)